MVASGEVWVGCDDVHGSFAMDGSQAAFSCETCDCNTCFAHLVAASLCGLES